MFFKCEAVADFNTNSTKWNTTFYLQSKDSIIDQSDFNRGKKFNENQMSDSVRSPGQTRKDGSVLWTFQFPPYNIQKLEA